MRDRAALPDDAIDGWCHGALGAGVGEVRFESGHLSLVRGISLRDGREVVVKVRGYAPRLVSCALVQDHLHERGFPCPKRLGGPDRIGDCAISAEEFVPDGTTLPRRAGAAERFASLLARLVDDGPAVHPALPLEPAPPWVGWSRPGPDLWPAPDDIDADLNDVVGPAFLEDAADAARRILRGYEAPPVIGHSDWESQNIRWLGDRPHVVHDWDSVVALPEAALAGAAAAVFVADGTGAAATVEETDAFLDAFARRRPGGWTAEDWAAAWAAGLWTRAFNAMKRVARGLDPDADLTEGEAAERLARARP